MFKKFTWFGFKIQQQLQKNDTIYKTVGLTSFMEKWEDFKLGFKVDGATAAYFQDMTEPVSFLV